MWEVKRIMITIIDMNTIAVRQDMARLWNWRKLEERMGWRERNARKESICTKLHNMAG